MTKDQLINRNEVLEQEILNVQNSVDYWQEESNNWSSRHDALKQSIESSDVMTF